MLPIWVADLVVVIVLVGVSELAFRLARRRAVRDRGKDLGTTQASTLGLLALVLGFTLAMAESRFDSRRQVVLDESLAVGTTYLRTDFLPEPQRSRSKLLLREYIDARIDFYYSESATSRSQALQSEIWNQLVSVSGAHDSPLLATYVTSLNQMIDLEASRDVVLAARVPWTIELLVIIVAIVAMGINGYAVGLGRIRIPISLTVVPLLVAFACAVLLDLDRSRAGMISTGNRPMERLKESLPSTPGTSSARASGRSSW